MKRIKNAIFNLPKVRFILLFLVIPLLSLIYIFYPINIAKSQPHPYCFQEYQSWQNALNTCGVDCDKSCKRGFIGSDVNLTCKAQCNLNRGNACSLANGLKGQYSLCEQTNRGRDKIIDRLNPDQKLINAGIIGDYYGPNGEPCIVKQHTESQFQFTIVGRGTWFSYLNPDGTFYVPFDNSCCTGTLSGTNVINWSNGTQWKKR